MAVQTDGSTVKSLMCSFEPLLLGNKTTLTANRNMCSDLCVCVSYKQKKGRVELVVTFTSQINYFCWYITRLTDTLFSIM
jgi:hypothetical protein